MGLQLTRDVRGAERMAGDGEGSIVDYASTVWRRRWMIATLGVVALVIAFVISMLLPKTYDSVATVLAPKEGAAGGLLPGLTASSGLLQQVVGLSLPSLTPNRDLLISVLRSRTIADSVVTKFDLQQRYRERYREDAINRLRRMTAVSLTKEGVIAVRVEDTDAARAAEMANYYVDLLDRLVAQYSRGEAGRQRGFLTSQLASAKTDLDTAEEELRRFQEKNRAIVLQEQTKGAIEAAARLKGEIIAAEVQLQAMRNFATEANPEIVQLRRRIDEMKRQLGQMQYGDGSAPTPNAGRRDFSVPFAKVPEVGLELARLTREVRIQETLVTLLTQQGEQARLVEAKDVPVVQVLDRAVPSERPIRPRVAVNMAVSVAGSLLFGVFLALFLDSSSRWRAASR
jgi:tyrosine-protein kinase Etk/Wzc